MSSPSLAAADQAPSRPPARSHARLLAEVLDHLPHAVLAVDGDWRIAMANARALGVLGRPRDAIVGTSLWALLPDLAESEVGRCCRQAAAERRPRAVDGAIPGLRGRFRIHATPVRAGGLVLHVRDVTAEHRIETEASHVAHRDPLTGVANRRHFAERLSHTVARRRVAAGGTARDRSAVLLFDVDGFAALNATRGHDAGDRLLQLVAERLGRAARGTDTVARVGPDEFAVLLDEVAADEELAAGARLLGLLDAPFALDEEAGEPAEGGSPVATRITACVGVVPVDGTADADAVVRHAGIALQRARAAGPARLAAFTAELQAETRTREALVAALRVAADQLHEAGSAGTLDDGGFTLAYQPVVDLATGRPTGVEALLRWHHPTLGPVSPAAFIPLAEEIGVIAPIGGWVLRTACTALAGLGAALREPGAAHADSLGVAVNVSGHQLQATRFADDVAAALAAAGLAPERLTLEVTETALVRDPRRARRVLGELRATGVRIAIDDFGTGYSSLGYLQQLPLDVLKIDKRFVDGVARGSGPSVAIPRAVVALGDALGLRTVGEGVETAAQRDALHALGCRAGQGYLFARPLPLPDLATWLDATARHAAAPGSVASTIH